MARPSTYKKTYPKQLITFIEKGGTFKGWCKKIGKSDRTVKEWGKKYKAFGEALKKIAGIPPLVKEEEKEAEEEVKNSAGFWKLTTTVGRNKLFETPEILFRACCEYFQAVEDNPLRAAEVVKYLGTAKIITVPRLRAMSISGLCIFLNIDVKTWHNYGKRDEFFHVFSRVNEIIKSQKFEGAAANLLNPVIIAHDLGYRDKDKRDEEVFNKMAELLSETIDKLPGA